MLKESIGSQKYEKISKGGEALTGAKQTGRFTPARKQNFY